MEAIRPRRAVTPREVAAHYDELDPFYRAIWGEHVHHGLWRNGRETPEDAAAALSVLVGDRLRLTAGEAVCDIGCGYGATARLLAERHGVRVTGITLSSAQGAIARERGTEVLVRDWMANGLADESFDAAYAIESSEHMPDLARFFGEALRVLRPGGRFAVCAWLAAERPSRWQERFLLEPICREGRLAQLGTETTYRRLMRGAGFEAIVAEDLTKAVRRTWSICLRRLARLLLREPAARRFLLDRRQENRIFAATIPRLIVAYRTGALRYVLLTAAKPRAGLA